MYSPGFADWDDKLLDGLLGEVDLHDLVGDDEEDGAEDHQPHQHPRPDHPAGVRAHSTCSQIFYATYGGIIE